MAVNLAQKWSPKVDERFATGSLTAPGVNNDYDFTGAKTVHVYNIETVAMSDYERAGQNRYGIPAELQDTEQILTLTRDRAFTFTIDWANHVDQMLSKAAGRALSREINLEVIPEIDTYRLGIMAQNAGTRLVKSATSANAYELFLDAQGVLGNNHVPVSARVVFVTYTYYAMLKLNPSFIGAGDIAQNIRLNGQLGMVDGVPVIPVPDSYLPANTQFILAHPSATVAPQKLAEYKVHTNPPGINGALVEGRVYYDAFVLKNKKMGIYASFSN